MTLAILGTHDPRCLAGAAGAAFWILMVGRLNLAVPAFARRLLALYRHRARLVIPAYVESHPVGFGLGEQIAYGDF